MDTGSGSGLCLLPLSAMQRLLTDIVVPVFMLGELVFIMLLQLLLHHTKWLHLACAARRGWNQGSFNWNGYVRTLMATLMYSCESCILLGALG